MILKPINSNDIAVNILTKIIKISFIKINSIQQSPYNIYIIQACPTIPG